LKEIERILAQTWSLSFCSNAVEAGAIGSKLTGLPVYSIYSFISWFQAGLAPRQFAENWKTRALT